MNTIIKKILQLLLFPLYVKKRFKNMEEWVQNIEDIKNREITDIKNSVVHNYYVANETYILTEIYHYSLTNMVSPQFNVANADKKLKDIIELLRPVTLEDFQLVRIGIERDGGYVMVDDFAGSEAAYSLGVDYEYSWDAQISEKNIPVFMYDHTVDSPKNLRDNMYFHKIGICATEREITETMNTIDNLIVQNGHEDAKNLILEMDIEGAEWDIFDALSIERLLQFKQIVCEFHWFDKMKDLKEHGEFYNKVVRVFEKLSKYYHIINLHINNNGLLSKIFGIYFPHLLEVSFIRKDEGLKYSTEWTYNHEINFPNNPERHCGIDVSYLFLK